jgi:hypothetical protein
VILSEPSNPWIAGVGNLFTFEFFELARRRLAPTGVLALWLQGYSISESNFKLVVRTLARVFPHITVWETAPNDYALVASVRRIQLPLSLIEHQLAIPEVRADLYRIGAAELHRLLSKMLTGDSATREWCGATVPGLPIHTDDNALLEFSAPRELFRGEDLRTFGALLARATPPLGDIAIAESPAHERLAERIARAAEARRLRLAVDEMSRGGGAAIGVAQLALEAARRDPGNPDLHARLRDVQSRLEAQPPDSETTALLAAIRSQRPPTLAARTGESLRQIADRLIHRADAGERGVAPGWPDEDRAEAGCLRNRVRE